VSSMTKVLVASASRHGATTEIAEAIGEILAAQGVDVDVKEMEDVDTVYPYDAYVLGSAVYIGSWLHSATRFIDEHWELVATRPTWLFSSGPIGKPPHPAAADSFDPADLVARVRARDHHLFGGKLDKHGLALRERAVAGALRVPEGDFREWEAVTAWATAIARSLDAAPTPGA
jgi:menaquinone-dependent protoporphyrinogen oxidase